MKKILFATVSSVRRRAAKVGRAAKASAEHEMHGNVVSVHRFQQGARDILVDEGGRRSYVFIPSGSSIRDIRAGETVRFTVLSHGGGHTAVSVA